MLQKLVDRIQGRRSSGEAIGQPIAEESAVDEFQMQLWGGRRAPSPDLEGGKVVSVDSESIGIFAASLSPGQSVTTPPIRVSSEHQLHVRTVGQAAGTGIEIQVAGVTSGAGWKTLHVVSVPSGLNIHLSALAGTVCRFRVRCAVGAAGSCLLQAFAVCAAHRQTRLNALSDYSFRLATEVQNFSGAAYTHAMYGPGGAVGDTCPVHAGAAGSSKTREAVAAELRVSTLARLAQIEPIAGEVTFNYAMRALGALLPMNPPDFFQRARSLNATRSLKILSICAGAARVEEQILQHCEGRVELTLLDASQDLISRAAARLAQSAPRHTINCLVGDINEGLPGDETFDVVICVSAMHHVADLETVLFQINERLEPEGEFWSIGEQVGRNGNRLWPDAFHDANLAFRKLPERLRKNAHTATVDAQLSDKDFSVACFEGIRSEELEEQFERHFIPVDVYKRNAFLWRLVDATYSDNYRLGEAEDIGHLRDLIAAEVVHWCMGGRSTELHGTYRKKTLRRA
jgi:ubiquinone/menaquinone biosynthesis C-methylase UbiE